MRKFFTHFVFAISFLCIAYSALSQATGDYRSITNGNWTTTTTWERFNGSTWVAAPAAPSSADNIITIRSPHTVIVNSAITVDQVVVASGGILTLPTSVSMNLNDGNGDDLVINGTMNYNDGTLGGTAGTVLITNTGTLLLGSAGVKSSNTGITITNNGTMSWQEGGLNFSAAVVNNNIFNISASALWQFSGGLTNTGTINKTAGSTTISTPWSNSGTINLSGGTLASSQPFTNTGTINITNGSSWQNGSTFNHNTGSVVSGTGTFSNSGTLTLNINQLFPATLVFSNTNTINGNGDLTVNNDFVIRGNITGGGAFTLNGNGDFQTGTLDRSLTIAASRTLLLSTADVKTFGSGKTLTNNGTMTWQEGGLNFGGAVINNNIFNISASALWQFSGGLTNTGTINKTAGSTTIATPWSNSGTINFSGGVLASSQPFTNTGTINITNGSSWQNGSTFNHNTGSVVSGTGTFSNSGTLTLNINQIFPATLVFSNTNTINGNGDLTVNNDFVIRGNITGSGAFTLNGNGDFQTGTLDRSLTIGAGRTLLLSTADVKTFGSGKTLTNNGTMTWQEGGLNFGGAVINNNIFNISASALWQFSGGLTNNATITRTNIGSANINTPVTNTLTGTIKGIGTLIFSSTVTNSGTIEPGLSPGIFTVDGTQSFSANSTLRIEVAGNGGAGNPTGHDQLQRGSNLTLSGTLTVVETGTVPDGDYTIISLTSGTITGTFSSTNLPANYSVIYNSNNVVARKGAVCVPSVSIAANPGNTICSGVNVTFTATPTNGGTPSYQWKLNGNNVGTNSSTYSNSALVNGDVITVVMTSSLACASPTTATSTGVTMVVTSTVTPSVSIAANPGNTICAGTNVTFTATPTNGGTPSYQWKLNGNNVGTNSNTYSNSALVNGDVMTVVMTSSLACASPVTATSNAINMVVTGTVTPSVSIAANPGNTICAGTNVTFTATPTNGGTPSYQWKLNGNNVGTNSSTYSNAALVNGDVITVVMTSSLACASPTTATSSGITMIVASTVTPSVSIAANPGNTICAGTNVTFTATPTNGGTPSYQWKLNGNNVGTNSNTYSNSALVNGDVMTVVMTSSLACASPTTATSTGVTMVVTSTVTPSVSIAANPGNTICAGTSVTFTATPTNGGTPSYQWKLNGNNVGTNSSTYSNSALVNGDVITVVLTSSLACASPVTTTSNAINMVVTGTVTPSVSIAANPGNTICAGTNITFTATPTNGGTASYQWKLNGNNIGTNSNTYSNNALVNGDIVTVVMTSSLACASPTTATSNGINMVIASTVTPSVSIAANPGNTICAGTNVTFTATPTNGGTPSYQWKLNGNNVGTNSSTYSNSALVNGDVITVVLTSSLACASPVTTTSNAINMVVTGTVTPSVSIAANPGNTICAGTNITFTATPTNGGTASYQWKLNGNNIGTNSNTYSNNALVNGDIVTVVMTSSLACASPTTATSNGINMVIASTVTPSVSIAANPGNTICAGTNVTFTATPTNGGSPSYQWKLNGNNIGTNSNTYSNSALVNGDVITVVMTSSLACASPVTATSNAINMVVTGTVTPSVSIAANPGNTICAGTSVTFIATPTNGGTPSYQWKLNGNNVGTNSNTYSNSALVNGDVITVVMTSSLACASPTTATSTEVTMFVTSTVTPSVSISANPGNTICAGTNVIFTATPTNGGTPSYQWKLNGNNVGMNSNTYSNNSLANGNVVTVVMTSSVACASPTTGTSTGITMVVTALTNYYRDQDGDGYGSATVTQQSCTPVTGYVTNNTDCNDNNAGINPAAAEICGNTIDDNCNGQTDENCTTDLPVLQTRTYPVKEGDNGITQFDLEIKLDKPATLQVRLNYATSDDEARAGVDYSPASGTLIIPQGSSSGIIRISIIGDLLRENNERFRINFSNPVNVTISGDPYSRVMIIDDDKGKLGTILRRGQPWRVPVYANKLDEVVIFNQQGSPVYKASNINNNISLGRLSAGTYHYLVRTKDENNVLQEYSGVIVIMD